MYEGLLFVALGLSKTSPNLSGMIRLVAAVMDVLVYRASYHPKPAKYVKTYREHSFGKSSEVASATIEIRSTVREVCSTAR